jgi:pantoate--beta-alanine ligase
VRKDAIPVEIVPCSTVRETDGLAMSSRNRRLGKDERKIAPLIYLVLSEVQKQAGKTPLHELKEWAISQLTGSGLVLDYFEIADAITLQPMDNWEDTTTARAFIACFLGNVRLIDNVELIF